MNSTIADLIERLQLVRHPEGGWYRETYRCDESAPVDRLPERFTGSRSFCTAIYFLLGKGDISALHRIRSDEMWHFYAGSALTVHVITPQGDYRSIRLGADFEAGETFQAVVPAGCWFGAELSGEGDYGLVGCTVSPGFDFEDFEMGKKDDLLSLYPEHADIIIRMARE